MSVINYMRSVMEIEGNAVLKLSRELGSSYEEAIEILAKCEGKVVVTGVGKSGHVGKKIAASLASTGKPAFFLHAAEGVHGDLGMVESKDVVILISNSGETAELLNLLPTLGVLGVKKIAITSGANSTLARSCDTALVYSYDGEADHLGLAPSTSSTLTLVIGDALAIALSILKGFRKEDFYLYHPGGSLGKRLSDETSAS